MTRGGYLDIKFLRFIIVRERHNSKFWVFNKLHSFRKILKVKACILFKDGKQHSNDHTREQDHQGLWHGDQAAGVAEPGTPN